jgi:deoxycytidine triphosphate deaminase
MKTPLEIYQAHLDTVSKMIWAREFEPLAQMMVYPHELLIGETVEVVDSPEAFVAWASSFRHSLEELGATAYHRVAIAAAFRGNAEDEIDGFHRVYVLNGASHLIEPYSSEAKLQKRDGAWLGSGVRATLRAARYAVDGEDLP